MNSKVKPIPVYSTIEVMVYQSVFHSVREHVRNSIHHETRYDINDALDWIVADTVFGSVSNNVNATLQDYGYSN
jgi:hypothetical protein